MYVCLVVKISKRCVPVFEIDGGTAIKFEGRVA